MTYRSCTALAVVAAALTAGPARAAAPSWTSPQDLGAVSGGTRSSSALATNDRGDAVIVFSNATGMFVARGDFSAPRRIASSGTGPSVAIDEQGVALIAFSYGDGTHVASDFRDDDCCTGVKVSVWRPDLPPTRPRAVRRRGITTQLGPIAATRGHRGMRIAGDEFTVDLPPEDVRLVPVRIDGRIGALRRVASAAWTPMTLQWAGDRAIAGLVRKNDRRTELGVARQRRSLRFAAPRRFLRLRGKRAVPFYDLSLRNLVMSPDGRGGQMATYRLGARPNIMLALSRKPLNGRVRTSTIRRGPASTLKLAPPVHARDGWIAAAWARCGGPPNRRETAYVTTRSPSGRLTTTAVPGPANVVDNLAVAIAPRGGGAVGIGRLGPLGGAYAQIVALDGGRPQPAVTLSVGPERFSYTPVALSANARDPARAVFEFAGRVFAARLHAAAG